MRAGILTISTRGSRGERQDESGPAIREMILAAGGKVIQEHMIRDSQPDIEEILCSWADGHTMDLILTTGGTGFAPSDVTPEATRMVIEREAPGLPEAMRAASLNVTPYGMLSRAVAGIRGRTLIINLPGSPKAVREGLAVILPVLPHAIALLWETPGEDERHSPPSPPPA
ncbi:MAG: MogA/MoaB family molybdenum cofactor biosynthesis protein [Anaerolineae bacterium]